MSVEPVYALVRSSLSELDMLGLLRFSSTVISLQIKRSTSQLALQRRERERE